MPGQAINFPANVSEVFNSLPRPLNSDGVVLVKPPESTSGTVSVPPGYQTASTFFSCGPESARASTSTNSACANTAQSSTSVMSKSLVVDALR